MRRDPALEAAFAACRDINRKHGTSYFFATRFFDRDRRNATHALYAFFRVPDDIVDLDGAGSVTRLDAWNAAWCRALSDGRSDDPVLYAAIHVFRRYAIPEKLAESFLAAMRADLTVARYATYEQLKTYMYGSAAAVGLMMTRVIGSSGPEAYPYAETLGYAMQLTNFIRDVGEDLRDRGRIYLPQEDLARFGIDEGLLRRGPTEETTALLRMEIARARALYREAEPGIAMLHPRGRYAVRLASRLYEAILDEVERNGYDVFSRRARTSRLRKAEIALRCLFT